MRGVVVFVVVMGFFGVVVPGLFVLGLSFVIVGFFCWFFCWFLLGFFGVGG